MLEPFNLDLRNYTYTSISYNFFHKRKKIIKVTFKFIVSILTKKKEYYKCFNYVWGLSIVIVIVVIVIFIVIFIFNPQNPKRFLKFETHVTHVLNHLSKTLHYHLVALF